MKSNGNASDNPRRAARSVQDEAEAGERVHAESTQAKPLLARVLERENLQRALKKVRQNKGAPGIDGMTVDELPKYLKHHWPAIRAQIVAGTYRPQPVRRVEIPKPDGKPRPLGIPTVLDRFIQQAIAQVISAQWEPHFHPHSYGYRPNRSAQDAVRHVQMKSVSRFISDSLRLTVNPLKSAVEHPSKRTFLGFTVSRSGVKLKVAHKAIDKLKSDVRVITRRTRGRRLVDIIAQLRVALLGWKAYFGIAEVLSPLRDTDKWVRRKLRCYLWKQWGRSGYRELRRRGVTVREAWHTSKSAHGPWRLSRTPALALALPRRYFRNLGLPELATP